MDGLKNRMVRGADFTGGVEFENLTDESVIKLIRGGDSGALDFLLEKYKTAVKIKARAYFLIGADKDDIIQEGMMGLYKAILEYDAEKSPAFKPFAELCIVRRMFSAIKASRRQKRRPLNEYAPIGGGADGYDAEKNMLRFEPLIEAYGDPEKIYIGKENKNYLESAINKTLTALEKNALALFLEGRSYSEISEILCRDEKSVDNSLCRVRKKVAKIIYDKAEG